MSKKSVGGFVVFSVALMLSFLMAEVDLRNTVAPIPKDCHFEKGAMVSDPMVGYRLKPNHTSVMDNGFFFEKINANKDGLRDLYDHNYGDAGIIAIEDSQTFGHGIDVRIHGWRYFKAESNRMWSMGSPILSLILWLNDTVDLSSGVSAALIVGIPITSNPRSLKARNR